MKRMETKWKDKVTFIQLNMSSKPDRALAKKLGNMNVTTLQFIGKDGKLAKQVSGPQSTK